MDCPPIHARQVVAQDDGDCGVDNGFGSKIKGFLFTTGTASANPTFFGTETLLFARVARNTLTVWVSLAICEASAFLFPARVTHQGCSAAWPFTIGSFRTIFRKRVTENQLSEEGKGFTSVS